MLDTALHGFRLEPGTTPVRVLAYADDITAILTCSTDVSEVQPILRTFELGTDVLLNRDKSKAMPLGARNTYVDILGITYVDSIIIPGVSFQPHSGNLYPQNLVPNTQLHQVSRTWYVLPWDESPHPNQLCSYLPFIQGVVLYLNRTDTCLRVQTNQHCHILVPVEGSRFRVYLSTLHLDFTAEVCDWPMFLLNALRYS